MIIRTAKRILALLTAAVLALALCAPALAERITVYAAKDNAKVYDARGKVLGAVPANTELTLTGVKGKICRVERDGKTAYMKKADLCSSPQTVTPAATPAPAATPEAEKAVTAYVNKDGAKVYNSKGKATGTLALNAVVTVKATKKGVCRIVSDGRAGYMRKEDLSASPVATVAPTSTPAPSTKSATAYVNKDGAKVYNSKGKAKGTLALNAAVTVTGVKKGVCRISVNGRTGYMNSADLSSEKTEPAKAKSAASNGSTVPPAKGTAREMDWWSSGIQSIFARGVSAQITDVETGLSWQEKRFGGTNHADCQPLTAADTAVMKRVYGGKWSWNRRAVFVTIDGVNYAASINGMPHGSGSIADNDFNGHHCIHFTNSRTHGSNKVCSLHQAAIKRAAKARL